MGGKYPPNKTNTKYSWLELIIEAQIIIMMNPKIGVLHTRNSQTHRWYGDHFNDDMKAEYPDIFERSQWQRKNICPKSKNISI